MYLAQSVGCQRVELEVFRAVLRLRPVLFRRPVWPPFPLLDVGELSRTRPTKSSGSSEARVLA